MILRNYGDDAGFIVQNISIFSGGGLISSLNFLNDKVIVFYDWGESISLLSTTIVAKIFGCLMMGGMITTRDWVIYCQSTGSWVIATKPVNSRYIPSIFGLALNIEKTIRSLPEESKLVGLKVSNFICNHMRRTLKIEFSSDEKKLKKILEEINKAIDDIYSSNFRK